MKLRQTANSIGITFVLVSLAGAGFGWALGGSSIANLIEGAASGALFAGIPAAVTQLTAACIRHYRRRPLPGLPIVIDPHRVH